MASIQPCLPEETEAISRPLGLVLALAGIIFAGELLVMLLLSRFPVASPVREAVIDAAVLLSLVSPALYWFVYRPLHQRLRLLRNSTSEIRALTRELLNTREEEQRRLSLDLHDELGQSLSALQFEMESIKVQSGAGADTLASHCDRLIGQVQQLGQQVRSIAQRLRPTLLDDLGLVPALEWLVEDLRTQQPGLNIEFAATGLRGRPPGELETALFRICQEALSNVVRHARASAIRIQLTASYPHLILSVADNGCGFQTVKKTASSAELHLGLLGIQERARTLGGEATVSSAPGQGTIVRARLPLGGSRHDSD